MATRRIIVGLDGSRGSEHALDWCITTAPLLDAEVVAVHVVEAPVTFVPERGMVSTYVESDPALRSQLDKQLHEWCAPLRDAELPHRAVLADGQPAHTLDTMAEKEDADLIVVGRRGLGGFKELLLGSVSHQLSHHARRPLVIIPAS